MNEKIGPALAAEIVRLSEHDQIQVHVFLADETAGFSENVGLMEGEDSAFVGSDVPPNRDAVVAALKARAERLRSGLLAFLQEERDSEAFDGSEYRSASGRLLDAHWINDSVTLEISLAVLRKLLVRSDVVEVELVREIALGDLLDGAGSDDLGRGAAALPGALAQATWSVARVNAPELWKRELRGNEVIVAVIDTGVNHDHPDLKNRMWDDSNQIPGRFRNFVDKNNDTMDKHGHGTACAGIIAGDGASGEATGVAPGARVMALRAESEQGIWDAMEFAMEHHAHVINMSMSWPFRLHPTYLSWRVISGKILAAGILHANSAGNYARQTHTNAVPFNISAPGNCPPPWLHASQTIKGGLGSVMTCGATNWRNELMLKSGHGPAAWEAHPYLDYPWTLGTSLGLLKPDICAPGDDIRTCNARFGKHIGAKPYRPFAETSAAASHVAGCMALLVEACLRSGNPVIPARIVEAIETQAQRIVGQTAAKENNSGAGRIDVLAAFNYGTDASRKWWA